MKYLVAQQELEIPEGVTINVKSRNVEVKGPLGTLHKSFKHIPFEMYKDKSEDKKDVLRFRMWLQKKKRNAVLGTARSIVRNMINGVTKGYKFKMVLAYSHFPIVVNILDGGKSFNQIIDSLRNNRNLHRNILAKCRFQLVNLRKKKDHQPQNHVTQLSSRQPSQHQDLMTLKKMENQHLQQQLQDLKANLRTLKEKRQQIHTQLQIFATKDQQTVNTLVCCQKDADEALLFVQQQKKESKVLYQRWEKDLGRLQEKKDQLTDEVKHISHQIDVYDRLVEVKRNNGRLQLTKKQDSEGTIVLYSKLQLQAALRSLYMILKFKKIWISSQNKECQELVSELNRGLDPIQKIRFMNKKQIHQRYEVLGCHLGEQLNRSICEFYELLSVKFDKTQRMHFQYTQSLSQLKKTQQGLNASILKMQESKTKDTIKILEANQEDLNLIQNRICRNCKLIFLFNLAFYNIIKKITSLNKTFDAIINQMKSKKTVKKTFCDLNQGFVNEFQTLLERSPEEVLLKWNSRINQKGSNQQEGKKYLISVMKNDLLRILAVPQCYQYSQSALENYRSTYDNVIQYEHEIMGRLVQTVTILLNNPIEGIKSISQKRLPNQLLHKGVIITQRPADANRYCVESKQYFRRDNFKLLQKLQRIQLKRKGLYVRPPFEIGDENQILYEEKSILGSKNPLKMMLDGHKLKSSNSERLIKHRHGNLLSEKRCKLGIQEKSIRRILGEISQIASSNYKYRIKKERRERKTHQVSLDRSIIS